MWKLISFMAGLCLGTMLSFRRVCARLQNKTFKRSRWAGEWVFMRTNFRCLTLPSVHSLNLPESTVYASLGTVQFLQKSFSFMVLKAILGSNLKPSRSPPLLRFLLLVTQFPVMCVCLPPSWSKSLWEFSILSCTAVAVAGWERKSKYTWFPIWLAVVPSSL